MSVFHDEIEIEDFVFNEEKGVYYYPCPCGDKFEISKVSRRTWLLSLSLSHTHPRSFSSLLFSSPRDLNRLSLPMGRTLPTAPAAPSSFG